jgi:hypothetical protein
MANNVYNFPQTKRAEPKPLKMMIGGLKPKPHSPRYFAGLVVLCALIGFVAVQAWPKLFTAVTEPVSVRLPFRCGSSTATPSAWAMVSRTFG